MKCYKTTFLTKKEASTKARNINSYNTIPQVIRPYKCDHCKKWHLTKHYKKEYKTKQPEINTGSHQAFMSIKRQLAQHYNIILTRNQLKEYIILYNNFDCGITEKIHKINRGMEQFKDWIININ